MQNILDRTLATIEARSAMYTDQMGEGRTLQVVDAGEKSVRKTEAVNSIPRGESRERRRWRA